VTATTNLTLKGNVYQVREAVHRSKLRIKARQFHMSRLHPHQWGEKQTIDIKSDWALLSEDERRRGYTDPQRQTFTGVEAGTYFPATAVPTVFTRTRRAICGRRQRGSAASCRSIRAGSSSALCGPRGTDSANGPPRGARGRYREM
jgi:hypothetical protein